MALKVFFVDNTDLTRDKEFTFLKSDASANATAITVMSTISFGTGQILCIGKIGDEETEILKTHTTTLPTGNTITLAKGLSFAHPQDTKICRIDWDQIAFSRATGVSSQKSTLATLDIPPDQKETIYRDTTNITGYGFVEFKETVGNTFSTVSDPIPYIGYADNAVFMIKKRAIEELNEEIDGKTITHEFLNEALWQARREYHNAPGKRPFRRKFNADIGNVSTGQYRVEAPSDLEAPYTAENMFRVRIGAEGNLSYYDKKEWDEDYESVAHTELSTAYAVGNKDLYCDDVRDFDDSGSVKIANDTVAYSAKGVSGGTLRISTAGTNNHSVDDDVWQGVSFSLPESFTIFKDATTGSAYIYFSCPFSTTYVDMNIWADYYRTLVPYDSDADELDEPNFDMFVPYLKFKIKDKKTKGELSKQTDSDYLDWQIQKRSALNTEYLGTEIRITPETGHLPIPA